MEINLEEVLVQLDEIKHAVKVIKDAQNLKEQDQKKDQDAVIDAVLNQDLFSKLFAATQPIREANVLARQQEINKYDEVLIKYKALQPRVELVEKIVTMLHKPEFQQKNMSYAHDIAQLGWDDEQQYWRINFDRGANAVYHITITAGDYLYKRTYDYGYWFEAHKDNSNRKLMEDNILSFDWFYDRFKVYMTDNFPQIVLL